MKKFMVMAAIAALASPAFAQGIKINVDPPEAKIYINNNFAGAGYAEFARPKGRDVAVIRIECEEYTTVHTKFYGRDKRKSISFRLLQDGFYRGSAASGLVNKYITVPLDPQYYTIGEEGKVDVSAAWKLLHQILLNYYPEIESTDYHGGYLQTPWAYKKFNLSDKLLRTRVSIRDVSTVDRVAFQIKISSEVAGALAARHGEFTAVDRLPKELEPMIEELQTRIGKAGSL